MKKIEFGEIKNILDYEKIRQSFRSKIINIKKDRRLKVGDKLTLTFENRHTVTFQIEEMIRVERIVDEKKIQEEIETYNELIPNDDELSATLFVEVDEQSQIKPVLDSLVGLNRDSVYMQVGKRMVPAIFEEGHATNDRISAVQYVRFKLLPEEAKAFADRSVPIRIVVKHKNYAAEANLPEEMRKTLHDDFAQGATANVWNYEVDFK